MTPCEYLEGLDYMLADLDSQLSANDMYAQTPNQYRYTLLVWNLQEVNVVLCIAEAFGLRAWLEDRWSDLLDNIYKIEEKYCEDIITKQQQNKSSLPTTPIGYMFSERENAVDQLVDYLRNNKDRFYDTEIVRYMLIKLASLWWSGGIERNIVIVNKILELAGYGDEQ